MKTSNIGSIENEGLKFDSDGNIRTEIVPDLLQNIDKFGSPFFKIFDLHHAKEPLRLNDQIVKNYYFPTLYADVTTAVAMFFCDYKAAQELLPGSQLKPVSMGFGRGLVVMSSYRYTSVYGIPTYNEVAISIPVVPASAFAPPVLPLLMNDFKNLGFYVVSMPVTSVENMIRGHKLWGLNKIAQKISLQANDGLYKTTVFDADGQPYLEFCVPMSGEKLRSPERTTTHLFSYLNQRVVRSLSVSTGEFVAKTNLKSLALPNLSSNEKHLKIGSSEAASTLRKLRIQPVPFQQRFGAKINCVFHLPESKSWE
jgi:hypothetical protein